ncbi:MAG TPA: sulfotransferase domain-containing protein [Holophagaceae bacterium]|nr:sulfotransferase domain-containing protein [Holophagaceae bacterium]
MLPDLASPPTAWPLKTRELQNHHMDSTIWNGFRYRGDDIVIATYGKAGTTWVQQIVAQLVFLGDPGLSVAALSPWVEFRVAPAGSTLAKLEAQTHRRILKTHLPVDALAFSPQAKYLYIGRDGRDVLMSWYHHHQSITNFFYLGLNGTPGRVGPPLDPPDPDPRRYFQTWLARDGHPIWPFWDNLRGWWEARRLPNVHVLHFNGLKADLEGEARRIAAFLEIQVPEARWPAILEYCTFAFMKSHAAQMAPLGGAPFRGGAGSFIHQGTNGRWREILTPADSAAYEDRALAELGPEAARWLATGEGA